MKENRHHRPPHFWFITGCSTGFGRELVKVVLARGWRAVVTARDKVRLPATARAFDRTVLAVQRGVTLVHVDGDYIGIVATDEYQAARAQELALDAIEWSPARLPDSASLESTLRAMLVDETRHTHRRTADGGESALAAATLRESYLRPFLAHASVGTCCAVAVPQGRGLKVFSHSQGICPLRQNLAASLGHALEAVQVVHLDGAGCYGHNGSDDVALDASLLAQVAQAPVRVAWSRREELTPWESANAPNAPWFPWPPPPPSPMRCATPWASMSERRR